MGLVSLTFLGTAALVFTGLYFLFRKFGSGASPTSNGFFWLSAIIGMPVIYSGIIFMWFLISSSYERKPFDKESWTTERDSRYVFIDDLVENDKLIGLSSGQIQNTLGEVEYEDDSTMIFYIGYDPKIFMNMDPDWLEIHLIEGEVIRVEVRE
ncbi:MAG: hypothetical protein GY816_10495 [Cytophagales bacterium]|nr:hypothetical protein [Cytophagales bacterium]